MPHTTHQDSWFDAGSPAKSNTLQSSWENFAGVGLGGKKFKKQYKFSVISQIPTASLNIAKFTFTALLTAIIASCGFAAFRKASALAHSVWRFGDFLAGLGYSLGFGVVLSCIGTYIPPFITTIIQFILPSAGASALSPAAAAVVPTLPFDKLVIGSIGAFLSLFGRCAKASHT